MENPKYILRTNETVSIPTGSNQPFATLRIVVWIIIGIIVVGSFVFDSNLFSEMSWTARMILIALAIGIGFWGPKSQPVPSPIEIWFYDNYLIIYREKRYYSKKISRKEYNKFIYSDIARFEYDFRLKRLDIIGKIDATWFNYNSNGTLPNVPSYHRVVDGGICYFYVNGNDERDIIGCIENFSSQKAVVKNNTEVSK